MNARNKNKRGMTLVELSVVLAIIAIVSTMVVTFVLMVNTRRRSSEQTLAALTDIELVESVTESFISKHPSCALNGNTQLKDGDEVLAFNATDGKLTYGGSAVALDVVTSVQFWLAESEGDRLYICTVEYKILDTDKTHVFCVNPYVGEAVSQ